MAVQWPNLRLVTIEHDAIRPYPRQEHGRTAEGFWAARMIAAQHTAPFGELKPAWGDTPWRLSLDERYAGLVAGVQQVLDDCPVGGTSTGSAVTVDFLERRGRICGTFSVYAFCGDDVDVIYDGTLLLQLPEGSDKAVIYQALGIRKLVTTAHGPVEYPSVPARSDVFTFPKAEHLVVSSTPLHWGPNWPPQDPRDVVRLLLDTDEHRDRMLAYWSDD